ncbi:MAG: Glycosyl transferase group 1 [Candidatus Falkowbacteria bacterium GW2011_GWC2_38_22]|uniref:Glycosyl transferase group 1 n=1 Tax=Candidatus Falkowbacteria bacterium GW2011_GWE1_38_31 TaxID=1618638 RepID=A0A0G0K716_9BACT|nr:MAG: Glycosyl transferase group 1 [Candidatus Falkowbacteria bacterium GW2011_GWF2_38_1205]KKQ61836.1 MAG: Glycosyl transferase group 1 [Candidatus Falkowbacteria bacterium GW2011_GWC2_38_22]KKQ64144.1 MAG: Glycosyl transferase group 1 [Candidatus Falkowbacteria bacterium GW2011_GWF1_38_22]KKQ66506.1 MAG: Glycosyl transferase group 1 [Candidatus Falkowbacteria bacterium GW2011_GWE2_38_254]KKQ71250.1 MAG: Glycosyl transferase group 1 [Candidatus Falkowbacteria bacterium GW2011_GWE1_38_31]KKQ
MKIIYIVNARIPTEKAHGYQITKMCEEFALAGAEVELWVPTRKNNILGNAFSFYGIKENFRIRYVKCFDFIRFDRLLLRKSVYLQSLWFFIKLAFEKADKDVIIYTRNPELVWLFNLRGFMTAYECHDWFGKKKGIALWLLRRCDRIIVTNNFIKQEFIKNGFAQTILVAPNGVNLEIFNIDIEKEKALQKLSLEQELGEKIRDQKILLYTGSFRTMGTDKGIAEILESLKILNRPEVFFLAVGGNEKDIAYYESLAKEIGVSDKCKFIGRRTQTELALWQKISDILLMPFPDKAHYRYFMTPLKIFEYMASGRPIIASDLPSIREILNNENAFFCKAGDTNDLSRNIDFVLNNPVETDKKAVKAKKDVFRYTWEKRVKEINCLLSKLS